MKKNTVEPIKKENSTPPILCCIGASAGGVEALKNLIRAIPPDSGMAFVVIQHQDPERKSLMVEIASHWTTLPVSVVNNNDIPQPDHVYLTPPGHLITFTGPGLRLVPLDPAHRHFAPIDAMFFSLAERFGPQGIGVVLSGSGRDGALGLKAIREKGGIGVVQEPSSAAYDFMPRAAIETAGADLVLPPEEIPLALLHLLTHTCARSDDLPPPPDTVPPQDNDTLLETILNLASSRKGGILHGYKKSTLQRRVERRMKLKHIPTLVNYTRLLQQEPEELDLLIQDILIGVTSFFRNSEAFQVLERQVIPRMFADKDPTHPVRVWVAGCATGEEAYSIAMLLHEYREQARLPNPIQIFATDLDDSALEEARTGSFREEVAMEVGPQRLARFFTRQEHMYRILREVRESVVFASHNLLSDPPFSRMDLVVCRNVFIYMEQDAQKKLLSVFRFVLNKDGYIFLGSSESLGQQAKHFEVLSKTWRIYRHQGKPPNRKDIPLLTGNPLQRLSSMSAMPIVAAANMDRTYRTIIDNHGPATVLISQDRETLYVSGNAKEFLVVAHGEPQFDILSMVKPALRSLLKATIERAVQDNRMATFRSHPDETGLAIRMTVTPISAMLEARFLLITLAHEPGEIPRVPALTGEAFLIQQLELELRATRDDLQRTIEQLRGANEELMAFNEETIAMNEELQSANEELESSKEELQSLNEELSIANAALDAKVAELELANDDLSNLFSSTDTAILFLDRQLRIKRFTPAATRLMRLIPSDVGRPMMDMAHNLSDIDPLADAQAVLDHATTQEREVRDQNGRWYLMRTLPYRTANQLMSGLVITFTEVTSLKEAEARDHATMIFLQDQAKLLSRAHLMVCDLDHRILLWNVGVEEIYGWRAEEAIGRVSHELLRTEFPQPLEEIMAELLHCGQWQGDLVHHTRGGQMVTIFSHWRLTQDGENHSKAVVQVNNDTSEHRNMEKHLRQAKETAETANLAKSDFLSNISHEIRTPMNVILGIVDLLLESAMGPEQGRLLQVCRSAGENLMGLVNDVLDISKIEMGHLELEHIPFNLRDEIAMVCDIMVVRADDKGLILVPPVYADMPELFLGDPIRLRQIFFNLLSNAIKFTSQGEIRLRVEQTSPVSTPQGHDVVLTFRVEDTGIGIPQDRLDIIFDIFMQADTSITRRFGGTGLGLAIVKRLVKKMGGEIHVESQLNQGSTFMFTLPFTAARQNASSMAAPTRDHALKTQETPVRPCRILLAEDSDDNRLLFQLYLEKSPHQLVMVHNGLEAVTRFKQEPFDLVLMDVQMPGMDGYSATQAIRQWERETNRFPTFVLALTAHATEDKREESLNAGCDGHLTKPIKKQKLLDEIGKISHTLEHHHRIAAPAVE